MLKRMKRLPKLSARNVSRVPLSFCTQTERAGPCIFLCEATGMKPPLASVTKALHKMPAANAYCAIPACHPRNRKAAANPQNSAHAASPGSTRVPRQMHAVRGGAWTGRCPCGELIGRHPAERELRDCRQAASASALRTRADDRDCAVAATARILSASASPVWAIASALARATVSAEVASAGRVKFEFWMGKLVT